MELQKGESLSLDYQRFDLSRITIGLGWDVSNIKPPFWKKWWSKGAEQETPIDLDAIAVLVQHTAPTVDWQNIPLDKSIQVKPQTEGDVVYYNQLRDASGHVIHSGDNTTGIGDGDDEQIEVHLKQLSAHYKRVVFIVSIYQGVARKHHFGMVKNAFIRALDATGREMTRFYLSEELEYQDRCTVIFGEVYHQRSEWFFRAVGEGYTSDDFRELFPATI